MVTTGRHYFISKYHELMDFKFSKKVNTWPSVKTPGAVILSYTIDKENTDYWQIGPDNFSKGCYSVQPLESFGGTLQPFRSAFVVKNKTEAINLIKQLVREKKQQLKRQRE